MVDREKAGFKTCGAKRSQSYVRGRTTPKAAFFVAIPWKGKVLLAFASFLLEIPSRYSFVITP